jgi:hypothetical protein
MDHPANVWLRYPPAWGRYDALPSNLSPYPTASDSWDHDESLGLGTIAERPRLAVFTLSSCAHRFSGAAGTFAAPPCQSVPGMACAHAWGGGGVCFGSVCHQGPLDRIPLTRFEGATHTTVF